MRSSFLNRLVAAGGALAVTLTGAVVLTAAPASAKTVVTDYGFHTFAYGTRIRSNTVALNAGRSAHSWIACTRYAGINGSNRPTAANFLTEAGTPDEQPVHQARRDGHGQPDLPRQGEEPGRGPPRSARSHR